MAKISITYLSKYGNGKMAMERLKDLLLRDGHDVSTYSVTDINPDKIPDSDLYVFSTSVHAGKPPGKMRKFVGKLSRDGGKYALVITHLPQPKEKPQWKKTEGIMNDALQSAGLTPTSECFSLEVKGIKGPLEDGWEGKIKDLAESISNTL
ncbi:MAG: flavodoxin family protein [Methanomassiliicoccales archaeon]|nr:flavodoxin family protein [Methanomassiliicoccales archaeon]NYT15484.1 flavodoxin family protein [Methanomassiliicoccales archaeon]